MERRLANIPLEDEITKYLICYQPLLTVRRIAIDWQFNTLSVTHHELALDLWFQTFFKALIELAPPSGACIHVSSVYQAGGLNISFSGLPGIPEPAVLDLLDHLAQLAGGRVSIDENTDLAVGDFELRLRYCDIDTVCGPAQGAGERQLEHLNQHGRIPVLSQQTTRAQVLIIEESLELGAFLHRTLSTFTRVTVMSDLEQALQYCLTDTPSIIITDLYVQGRGINTMLEQLSALASQPSAVVVLTAETEQQAINLALAAGATMVMKKPFDIAQLLLTVHGLLPVMQEPGDSTSTLSRRDNLMKRALTLIEQHCNQASFKASNLADLLNVSERSLQRLFKEMLDESPSAWLLNVRLTQAYKLLSKGSDVTTALYQAGFNHPGHFTRCFKAKYGVLPVDVKNHGITTMRVIDANSASSNS